MEAPAFRQRPDSLLPMAFFAFGLAGFIVLQAALAVLPRAVRWPLGPHGILLLHLTVLGWITPVMMGADHQLLPVVLHAPVRGRRLATVVWGLYASGAATFLLGWALVEPGLIAAGGVAAGAALLGFCGQMGAALARGRRWDAPAAALGGGMLFLAGTAVLGPWMALAADGAVVAPDAVDLRALHAAAGLGGWLLLTLMGATYRLVPYFGATPPAVRPRCAGPAVALAGAGTVLLLIRQFAPAVPGAAGLGLISVAVGLWLYDLVRLARHGRQTRREPVVALSLAGAASVAIGGAAAVTAWRAGAVPVALAGCALGLLAGPSLLILGQLQKIVPFLAALDAAGNPARRGPVPRTESLFPRRRATLLLGLLLPGFAAEVAGLATGPPALVRLGALLVLAAAIAYAAQQGPALAVWLGARRRSPATDRGAR